MNTPNSPNSSLLNISLNNQQNNLTTINSSSPINTNNLQNFPSKFYKKGLKFCHVNLNSIRNKFSEVQILLNTHKIVAFVVTESKLDSCRDKDNMYMVTNYTMIRYDRTSNKGGGTLIYVSDDYKFDILEHDLNLPDVIEIYVVKIWKDLLKPILLVSVYRQPKVPLKVFIDFLSKLHLFLVKFDNDKIIFGDFNVDLIKQKIRYKSS
jgi:hypothetical protein